MVAVQKFKKANQWAFFSEYTYFKLFLFLNKLYLLVPGIENIFFFFRFVCLPYASEVFPQK